VRDKSNAAISNLMVIFEIDSPWCCWHRRRSKLISAANRKELRRGHRLRRRHVSVL